MRDPDDGSDILAVLRDLASSLLRSRPISSASQRELARLPDHRPRFPASANSGQLGTLPDQGRDARIPPRAPRFLRAVAPVAPRTRAGRSGEHGSGTSRRHDAGRPRRARGARRGNRAGRDARRRLDMIADHWTALGRPVDAERAHDLSLLIATRLDGLYRQRRRLLDGNLANQHLSRKMPLDSCSIMPVRWPGR